MPFKSFRQQRYLFAKEPEVAKKWAKKYGALKKPKGYKLGKKKRVKRVASKMLKKIK